MTFSDADQKKPSVLPSPSFALQRLLSSRLRHGVYAAVAAAFPRGRDQAVLHRGLRSQTPSRDPDRARVGAAVGQGRGPPPVRLAASRVAQQIAVWVDRSPRLAPFFPTALV